MQNYYNLINIWKFKKNKYDFYKNIYKNIYKNEIKKIKKINNLLTKKKYFKYILLKEKKYNSFKNYLKHQIKNNLPISKEIIYNIVKCNEENNLIYFLNNNLNDKNNNKNNKLLINFYNIKNFFNIIDNCFLHLNNENDPIFTELSLLNDYLIIGINTLIYKTNNSFNKNILKNYNCNINSILNKYFEINNIYSSNRKFNNNTNYYLFIYKLTEIKNNIERLDKEEIIQNIEENIKLYLLNIFKNN